MARATKLTVLITTLVLTLGVTAVGAEEGTSHIDTLAVAVTDSDLTVTGKGVFTGTATEVGTDPTGDGTLPGTDLVSATITQVSQSQLRFELGVADLPPGIGGTPEVVNYNWPLQVVRGSLVSEVSLQAWRSSTAADLLCGVIFACPGQEPGGNPRFTVNTCAPDPNTGQNLCSAVGVDGEFTEDGLAWILPAGAVNAGPGAVLHPAGSIAASYGGSGLTWNTAGTGGDTMFSDSFTYASPTVQVGVASADTAPEDVALTTAATVTQSNGNFTASLPRPDAGSHVVAARACLGDSCGAASELITVE